MTKFRDFGSGVPDGVQEDISFKLYDETFQCLPRIQGKVILDIVKSSGSSNPGESASIITDFFKLVLTEESYTRFDSLISSKDKFVEIEKLGEITGWLIEEYTARPKEEQIS